MAETPGERPDTTQAGDRTEDAEVRPLRRILIATGLTLVALILVGVAVYAVAFLILAPMMQ